MIRVLLVDDHPILRDGLVRLLENSPDISVVGNAGDGQEAIRQAAALQPDVIVMDIAMPVLNGIDATQAITVADTKVVVLGLSTYADRGVITEFLRAGGKGFLSKQAIFEELVHAIRVTLSGSIYVSSALSSPMAPESSTQPRTSDTGLYSHLTDREKQVLQHLADGLTVKQAATRLCISPKTCHTHRARLMEKLGVHSMADLTKYAIRQGLTSST